MYRIIKIGMDVHSTNYTLCALEVRFGSENNVIARAQVEPVVRNIKKFVDGLKTAEDDEYDSFRMSSAKKVNLHAGKYFC